MNKQKAYIIYRVLMRLHNVADLAFVGGREDEARAMWRLIGLLEYQNFECITCESSLEEAA